MAGGAKRCMACRAKGQRAQDYDKVVAKVVEVGSYAGAARFFGLSRQAVHQICRKMGKVHRSEG